MRVTALNFYGGSLKCKHYPGASEAASFLARKPKPISAFHLNRQADESEMSGSDNGSDNFWLHHFRVNAQVFDGLCDHFTVDHFFLR